MNCTTKSDICHYSILMLCCLLVWSCKNKPASDFIFDPEYCNKLGLEQSEVLKTKLDGFADELQNKTGVLVLEEGKDAILSRAWLCDQAQESIDIQYFIYSNDNIGIIATDYLLKAACRGVKVRIIIDDLMLNVDNNHLLALHKHDNVEIKIYNPNLNIGKNLSQKISNVLTDFRGINQRMHHKTFIVDNEVAITGGRNIADEYFDFDHEYNFRDRDVLLIGKSSRQIKFAFEEYWNDILCVPVDKLLEFSTENYDYQSVYKFIDEYASNPQNYWPQIKERISKIPEEFDRLIASEDFVWVDNVDFVSDAPGKNETKRGLKGGGKSTDALVDLIKNAKKEVIIQSPYLVVSDLSLGLFSAAVKRGVDIKIQTNSLSSTDNLEAFSGYKRNRTKLLETGIEIYEFKPDALIRKKLMEGDLQDKLDYTPTFAIHCKSMVVDDSITVIGTFNLDPRSANLNTECISIIRSKHITAKVKAGMMEELKSENAWQTTKDFNPDKIAGWKKRFKIFWRRIIPQSIL